MKAKCKILIFEEKWIKANTEQYLFLVEIY